MKEKLNKGRYFQGNRFISEEVNLKTSLDIPVMSSIVQKCVTTHLEKLVYEVQMFHLLESYNFIPFNKGNTTTTYYFFFFFFF